MINYLRNTLLFLAFIASISACQKNENYQKTKNGLEYVFHSKDNEAVGGELGDYYIFDLIVKRSNDSIISNSYTSGIPAKFLRRKSLYKGDIYEALAMCHVGDSLTIKLVADSFYQSHNFALPDFLVPGEILFFTIKMQEILKSGQFKMKMFESELDEIEKFIAKKRWQTRTDSSTGIKYEIVRSNPGGTPIAIDDSVSFTYFYYYLNEKIIARSKENDYWTICVGDPNHITGLSRALTFMKEGEKMRAILPFSEAFGEEGRAAIPPYSSIVIELDVNKVKKK